MNQVQLNLSDTGKGLFYIEEDGERIAKMYITITPGVLRAIHTEVDQKAEGRGLAKQLLTTMVQYARDNTLNVIPDCPYVRAQFQRHPDEYADIWKQPLKS
jgi:uncharacterized protein